MLILPAIDLYEGRAVRLLKGDYGHMTVYSSDPPSVADDFKSSGASAAHIVDLEGARTGGTPNFDLILEIKRRTGLFCEVGGGIRSMEVIEQYLEAGIDRVILGTAAVTDESLVKRAAAKYGERIAVGADIMDGRVAIRGWTEKSDFTAAEFCARMAEDGVSCFICTDIAKDGAMAGANHELYRELFRGNYRIIASGGVSSLSDVRKLAEMGLYGAIIGKAYYEGMLNLREAIEAAG
jgi:phosphoribosylformimino-5-aminoimidazole carboxamide ribotide isomerase